jgi:PAS domain S-box-containing protein
MVDNHFRFIECNQEIVRLFGLKDKQFFLDRISELSPEYQPSGEISADQITKYIIEAFEEGYCRFEWIHQKLNGERIPTNVILVRVKYRGVYAVAGYIMDLRELKAMMEKIKEAEERTMMMVDSTPLGITMWDENVTLIDFNYEAARVVGIYNKPEFREKFAQTVPEYQPDGTKSTEKLVEFISAAFKDGSAQTDWCHNTVDGESILFESMAVRLKYKDKSVVVVYCRDIRELNAAIAKMREADECTQVLFDATPLSCFMIDNANKIIECNQEIVRLFGLSGKKEYIDRFFDFFPEYQPSGESSREKIIKYIYEAFEEGYCNFEWIHQKLDGEQIPTEVSLVRVKYKGVYAVAGYIRDLRELKTMIAEMHRAEIAEESNKAKSDFLAKMSHEIRTPMNAILGITEIQLQDSAISLVQREALERIYNSGDLLLGIINDILDLSKIEAGKLELNKIQYDIASLIHDIVKLNVIRYESKPIEFKLNVSENIPTLLIGDELRIKQILNNLLSNAFKYTDEGNVELTFFTEGESDSSGLTLVIQVSDTGQGMTAEQVKKIGDKYSRFNMEANRKTEGTGLGMNITRNLVQLMNGNIHIESTPEVGSTFTVRLQQGCSDPSPIGKELADNLMKLNLKNTAKIRNLQIRQEFMPYGRVLVVDDVETNLYVARGLMAPYGLAIDTVLSGFDAIDKISEGAAYDVIFMDHMMPRMDGIEAVKIIRSLGYSQPVVALTANAISGQAEMFLNNGFDEFISKPIDVRQLNIVLNRFIRDKQPPEVIEEARMRKNYLYASGRHNIAVDSQLSEFFVRDAQKAAGILTAIYENNCRRAEDISAFIINIHSMKSALANIGEGELSEKASKLEYAGRNQDVDMILSALPGFLESLHQVIEKLKPPEDEDVQENTGEDNGDMPYLQEKLVIIQEACESFDKKAAKDAVAALKLKTWNKKIKEQLSAITECLLHSEFDEASAIAKEISY